MNYLTTRQFHSAMVAYASDISSCWRRRFARTVSAGWTTSTSQPLTTRCGSTAHFALLVGTCCPSVQRWLAVAELCRTGELFTFADRIALASDDAGGYDSRFKPGRGEHLHQKPGALTKVYELCERSRRLAPVAEQTTSSGTIAAEAGRHADSLGDDAAKVADARTASARHRC